MGERHRGPRPGSWEPGTERGRAVLADAIERYRQHETEDTLPRSGRGIFYDLRPDGFGRGITYIKRPKDPGGWYDPTAIGRHPDTPAGRAAAAREGRWGPKEAGPDYVQEIVVDARRAGSIVEDRVADARAPSPLLPDVWDSPEQLAATVANLVRDFGLDRQDGQPVYVELWCEASDLMARLERVAGELSVPVYSGAGFDGLKSKRQTADRILRRRAGLGRRTVVLEVSDLDEHGLSMVRARDEDIAAWVRADFGDDPDDLVTFERIAVPSDQARRYDVLDDDGKAEADALPVPVLDEIVRDAIDRHHVPARREATDRRVQQDRERLPDLIRDALDDGEPA